MRDDERRELTDALFKVLGVAVGIGVAIAVVVLVLVKALGVGGDTTPAAKGDRLPETPLSSLPTKALTPSGSPSDDPSTESPSASATPTKQDKQIQLSVSPALAGASERINLSGTYLGKDNAVLQVQRKEAGRWTPFADVKATVRAGSFATYVMTSRSGENLFRVYDPVSRTASNPVTVTVR